MSEVERYVDDDKDEKDEKDEQFVAVETEPEGDDDDVDGQTDGDDDDKEDKEESRLGGGRDEDDDDDKRSRRREENKTRRARQKDARDRTERELKFLRNRNEQLERQFSDFEQNTNARMAGNEAAQIDGHINKAKSDLQLANQVIAQAAEQSDGKNLAEALDHRDTIRDNLRDLEQAKGYLSQEGQRRGAAEPQQLDPRHVAHAQSFMVDHDWWDPVGRDQDSQKVLMIDRSLVQEGFEPSTKEYWDELRLRVQTELPQHSDAGGADDDDEGDANGNTDKGKPKGDSRNRGPAFRTGGRERPLKRNEVYISPERKDAMVEAGVWEDPVLRNNYLKAYAKYDKEEGNTDAR